MQLIDKSDKSSEKLVEILSGLYPVEKYKDQKWIWTGNEVLINVKNVKSLSFTVVSPIKNRVTINGEIFNVVPKMLTILKVNVEDLTRVKLSTDSVYIPSEVEENSDSRELGVMIQELLVDGIKMF